MITSEEMVRTAGIANSAGRIDGQISRDQSTRGLPIPSAVPCSESVTSRILMYCMTAYTTIQTFVRHTASNEILLLWWIASIESTTSYMQAKTTMPMPTGTTYEGVIWIMLGFTHDCH